MRGPGPGPPHFFLSDQAEAMNVTLHERSAVDYDLEIHVTAEELAPRLEAALREQRKKMNLKGFRPGRVPMQMVRKIHGSVVAQQLAEDVIGQAWREQVAEKDELKVLGAPRLARLEFDLDRDLHAVLRFGVQPEVALKSRYDRKVRRLVRPVSDEDVEQEIERRLFREAELVETELPAAEDSVVTADLHEVDAATGTPIIGRREEDREIDLQNERLREEMRRALIGKKPGDTVRVDLPHQHGEDEGHDHDDHVDRFLVTVKAIRHRIKPELDEAFIKEQTAGRKETVEEYHELVRVELEEATRRLGEDFLREEIVEALIAEHDIPAPETLVESILDEMEDDVARQFGGEIPQGFDREGFRAGRREIAERQARWALIQEQVVEEADLKLREEDLDAEFERLAAGGPGTTDMIRQFVASQPQVFQGIQQRLMTRRLFENLAERFEVVDVTPDELEQA
jgi:trigger factor